MNSAFLLRMTKTPWMSSSFFCPLDAVSLGAGDAASTDPGFDFFCCSSCVLVRMVSAWMGMASVLPRVAVVILAVVERPGRRSCGGSWSVTTTLKSFASSLVEACCDVERPLERTMALSPISETVPWKTFFGIASMVTSADWPSRTFTISVSSTLTSAVMTDMLAIVISVLPSAFWMPMTTDSPSRTGRFVTTPS